MIFVQSKKFTGCKVNDEIEDTFLFFDGVQSTEHYPYIWKYDTFKDLVKRKLQHTRIFNVLLIGLSTNSSL